MKTKMKTVELFCASPASTAICSSMDQRRMVRRAIKSSNHGGSNRHDHHGGLPKPITTTSTTRTRTITVPCNSCQIPYSPTHKSSSELLRRKSSADVSSDLSSSGSPPPPRIRTNSSRYLLSDNPIFDFLSENKNNDEKYSKNNNDFPVFRTSSSPASSSPAAKKSSLLNDIIAYKASLSSSKHFNINGGAAAKQSISSNTKEKDLQIVYKTTSPQRSSKELVAYKPSLVFTKELSPVNTSLTESPNQVVELKVSIHCRGCEGKIRKHISRMEGVTSFTIDLATKKVTIVGNVTPLSVLSSVSKVKYAEFWSSPASSSSASSPRMEI